MSKALLQSSEIVVCYVLCKFLAKFWFIAHNISIQIQKMNMNFASTQSTISSCPDVSLDINLLGCFSCKIQRYRIPNPPRPTCRVSARSVQKCPGLQSVSTVRLSQLSPTLNRPPPTCPPHLFFCQKLPDWPIRGRIKAPRAGLTGAHRVKEGRNLSVRSTSTRGSERYLKLDKVDGLDVGLFDHSMWLCKKPVVFTIVYECGAKWPSGREKHECGTHNILSFL